MPNPDFVKGVCRHCAGHIEFSSVDAGRTTACPHCGQPTELIPLAPPYKAKSYRGVLVAIGVTLGLIAAVGGYIYLKKTNGNSSATLPPPTQTNNTIAAAPKPPPGIETNDFNILAFQLEKTPGSSLVYVTGAIRNATDRQRFGVKVTFGLFDTNDVPIGSATDYQSVIEPNAEWHFKALVIESKAATAKFSSIVEDK